MNTDPGGVTGCKPNCIQTGGGTDSIKPDGNGALTRIPVVGVVYSDGDD